MICAMIEKYKDLLSALSRVLSGSPSNVSLRFNRSYVTVSDIAQQFYCEEKLRLMYSEGKVETPDVELGRIVHESLLSGHPITVDELISKAIRSDYLVATIPLVMIYRDVPIVGVPDAMVFSRGRVLGVVEIKTSNRWLFRLFRSEYVQAQLYAYMAYRLGLCDRSVKVLVAKVRRDPDVGNYVRSKMFEDVRRALNLNVQLGFTMTSSDYVIHARELDLSVERDLEWALRYWRFERDEQTSSSRGKCISCEYRHLCSKRAI